MLSVTGNTSTLIGVQWLFVSGFGKKDRHCATVGLQTYAIDLRSLPESGGYSTVIIYDTYRAIYTSASSIIQTHTTEQEANG